MTTPNEKSVSVMLEVLRAVTDHYGLRLSDRRLQEAWVAAPADVLQIGGADAPVGPSVPADTPEADPKPRRRFFGRKRRTDTSRPSDDVVDISRLLAALATIGLNVVPQTAAFDGTVPVLSETPDGVTLERPGADPIHVPLDHDTPRGPQRRWRLVPADQADQSTDARLRAINPLRNLGMQRIIWVLLAALLSNILGLATSLFVMVVYDRVLPTQATESLYALSFGVALAVMFDTLLKGARSRIVDSAAKAADQRVTEDIFDQYIEQRPAGLERSIGELASIIRNYESYREFMTAAMVLTLVDLPFVFLFIFVIAQISGTLWIVPAIAVPVVIVLVALVQPLAMRASRKVARIAQTRQSLLVELLSGLDHLRVAGAYGLIKRRFLMQSEVQSAASTSARSASQAVGTVISVVQQVFQVAVIVLGFHLFQTDAVTMGGIIAAVILFGRVMAPLARVAQTLGRGTQALTSYRTVRDFLAQDRTTDSGVPVLSGAVNAAALEVSNVTVRPAPDAPAVLEGVSLKVQPGEKIAIVGPTGSGKSTLLRLMSGLVAPETGTVLCQGVPIGAYPRADLHQLVGVVFQQPWMFAGTMRENVGLGRPDISDADIVTALRQAGLIAAQDSDAAAMPLDMVIAEQGANLSGGQRQAVNIARAFAADPAIYLMDEPSSAMDARLETQLVQNIGNELASKAMVMVTHKAKLIEVCDRIIAIDHGQIVSDMSRDQYLTRTRRAAAKVQAMKQSAPKVTKVPVKMTSESGDTNG